MAGGGGGAVAACSPRPKASLPSRAAAATNAAALVNVSSFPTPVHLLNPRPSPKPTLPRPPRRALPPPSPLLQLVCEQGEETCHAFRLGKPCYRGRCRVPPDRNTGGVFLDPMPFDL